MTEMIPPRLKKLWDKWNIRGVIILSLFLQTILIFSAPSRKRTAKKFFLVLIWSAYLLADWAADYAVGQISDSQEEESESKQHSKNRELLAFWSPFLLLHLGGPDTITALALEDNELWDRHLFSLLCQAIATVYVILLSIPNRLLVPTVIMFVGGVIKYVERTAALFSASLDKFKDSMLRDPDPGANYAKLMEEYAAKKEMNMPTEVILVEDTEKEREGKTQVRPSQDLTSLQVVQYAYKYYNIFKGLIVDLIFTNEQRDESRKFFDSLSPEEALSIIEVELSLIYDSMFTKAEILHNWIGVAFRFIALGCLVTSLCLFKMKKEDQYDGFDVALTYALLICGIALDSIALFMFSISDWTIARLRNLKEDLDDKDTFLDKFFNCVLSVRKLKWKRTEDGHQVLNRNFFCRRWTEYVHAYNLIGYCLNVPPKRIHHNKGKIHTLFDKIIHFLYIDIVIKNVTRGIKAIVQGARRFLSCIYREESVICKALNPLRLLFLAIVHSFTDSINELLDSFGIQDLFEEIRFTTSNRLTRELWEFIFKQVQEKNRFAQDPETSKSISSARGDWTLVATSSKKTGDGSSDHSKLLQYVTEKDYDQSILMWHIATELFYQSEIDQKVEEKQDYTNRELSKMLSDYMMYLLQVQPTLMSAVSGISKIRFRDTCAEAEEFFGRRHINKSRIKKETDPVRGISHIRPSLDSKGHPKPLDRNWKEMLVKEASRAILSVNTDVEPMDVKGDRSKSVLFDGCVLAKELMRLKSLEEDIWEVVSKVWVELLCFAATHCDSKEHASQLSNGGELINFVWLLMAHFGLGDQFQINRDDARAKLIVAK